MKSQKKQTNFTRKDIDDKLKDYKEIVKKDLGKILPGDSIRYFTNNEFRGGGVVKINKFPEYIVLLNVIKNVTWCMQIKSDPTLKVFVKSSTIKQKQQEEMKKVYEMYKQGKLQAK